MPRFTFLAFFSLCFLAAAFAVFKPPVLVMALVVAVLLLIVLAVQRIGGDDKWDVGGAQPRKVSLFSSLALLFGALALSACTTTPDTGGLHAPSPRQIVYGLNTAYIPVATIAAAYVHLPACNGSIPLCAVPSTVATIRADDSKAYEALQRATNTVETAPPGSPDIAVDIAAAEAALGALQDDTARLKVK